ncbi:hypothetical protein Back11_39100 [Paenibacillus baekrokdamisoli]|uniref:Uncharacterized protein n=1 Tax=Paenibacillus baekrokdamisoli TaxID=1712516 RepID=A0A3G9J2I0_9BACL|nr:hypothetical protein [Paenibacillus baekrokdamisoli]MBB3068390.1 hypothetical protein [Paenibacillus baekrokdamisoli]BBH22565.1 hypothetical protein Back11_39100 [Paenibacillus baekrokdamisoli]
MELLTIGKLASSASGFITNYIFKKNVIKSLDQLQKESIETRIRIAFEKTIDLCISQFIKNDEMSEETITLIVENNTLLELVSSNLFEEELTFVEIDLKGYGITSSIQTDFIRYFTVTLQNNLQQDIEIRRLLQNNNIYWKTERIYDTTRAILGVNNEMNLKIDKFPSEVKKIISEELQKSLSEEKNERIKPHLLITFDSEESLLFYPEKYSEVNKKDDIKNYSHFPSLSQLFNIAIVNTGMGYAKNVEIIIEILKEDAFVTDRNLLWIFMNPVEQIEYSGDKFVQSEQIAYIENEEGISLPINSKTNGIIISSIYNINNFIMLSDKDFTHMKEYYDKKKLQRPLLIPSIYITLNYQDIRDNRYTNKYKVDFIGTVHVLGSHFGIKAKADFNYSLD